MVKPHRIHITKFAEKQLKKLSRHIMEAIYAWVRVDGLQKTRRVPGYHDEPLKGEREGQRSIRLNRAYRLIYEELDAGQVTVVIVQEVNKHEY